ncbi:MAG: ribonuclease HI family protein [Nitrospirae bacterium]|nr:ribonuclease HI family protein [Nitrospirota bacterium]
MIKKVESDATDLIIYTDGVSRGNPGDAGIGVIIKDAGGKVIDEIGRYIGIATNNIAEYSALVAALKYAVRHKAGSMKIFSDSELMVKQMNGEYRVKDGDIAILFKEAQTLIERVKGQGSRVVITHILREENREADKLANRAVNLHFGMKK